jgi:hypothetical protein
LRRGEGVEAKWGPSDGHEKSIPVPRNTELFGHQESGKKTNYNASAISAEGVWTILGHDPDSNEVEVLRMLGENSSRSRQCGARSQDCRRRRRNLGGRWKV